MNTVDAFRQILAEDLQFGYENFADHIKARLYSVDKSLFENIDFDVDDNFLDPFLVLKLNYDPFPQYGYQQLLDGYTKTRGFAVNAYFDEAGIAYFPNIGYYHSTVRNRSVTMIHENGKTVLIDFGEKIDCTFTPFFVVPDTRIELIQFSNPLLRQKLGIEDEAANSEFIQPFRKHHAAVLRAMECIKRNNPWYYTYLLQTLKKIVLFENASIRSFTAINTLGIDYIKVSDEKSDIYFVEELIHQTAHNIFYFMTIDMNEYFSVDVKKEFIKNYNKNEDDGRTIYSAVHGVVSLINITSTFTFLFEDELISGKLRHELCGRFSDNLKRLGRGLNDINHKEIFTNHGWQFIESIRVYYKSIVDNYQKTADQFDTSNQPYDFDYALFEQLNPFTTTA
jgi:hypothetical protein